MNILGVCFDLFTYLFKIVITNKWKFKFIYLSAVIVPPYISVLQRALIFG